MTGRDIDRAVESLRGNASYEKLVEHVRKELLDRTDEMVLSRDPNDALRAQGAVRQMRSLLQDLAP